MIPALLFMGAAWNSQSASFSELLSSLGRGTLYFWLYIFPFCLSNQIAGIEEDRINKPDRPLCTGLVSYRGAIARWVVSMMLFTLVGWWCGVLKWTLLWQACIILHNFGGWAKHWVTKGIIMGVGAIAELAPAWEMVTPLTAVAWRWILLLTVVVTLLITLQDLRDIEGDRATGRNTFPIAFGETNSRVMLSVGYGILPLATHFGLIMPVENSFSLFPSSLHITLWDLALAGISLCIAARIALYRSPKADHQTYMMFTYWYCLVLGSAIALI